MVGWMTSVQSVAQFIDSGFDLFDDIPDIFDLFKMFFQFIDLGQDAPHSVDLVIRLLDGGVGPVAAGLNGELSGLFELREKDTG